MRLTELVTDQRINTQCTGTQMKLDNQKRLYYLYLNLDVFGCLNLVHIWMTNMKRLLEVTNHSRTARQLFVTFYMTLSEKGLDLSRFLNTPGY